MTPKPFIVWGWKRTVIYGFGLLFIAFCVVKLISYPTPEYTRLEKLPSILAPAAWAVAGAMLAHYRQVWAARIRWTTDRGMMVIPAEANEWLAARAPMLERRCDEVLDFWRRVDSFHDDKITEALNGLTLVVVVSDDPLWVPQHGIKAKGLAWPDRIVVRMDPAALKGSRTYTEEFWTLVQHEASHAVMSAMGVPQVAQHERMRQAGAPWA